ncbi:RHS repeat-associated core domain-containing protein [Streptomyces sp. NPDC098077]|uniref:RHS repeat-associated core domain-containing protein n=1 Tax=Streptomyces sp. NPDC098077 TaxID=3366093 RepID=UPI0038131546
MPRPDPGRGTALRLGSFVALTDEASTKVNTYAYSPRGVQRAATTKQAPQPYRFAGGYQDPTGLYHFAARFYDPNIGRFTTPDPSGQEQNPYLYAAGDPVNNIDPTGLLSLGGFVDKAGTAFDVGRVVSDLASGDTKAGFAGLAGMAGGALVGATCGATPAAFGATTGGVGLAVGASCYAATEFGSYAAEDFVNRQF